MKQIAATLQGYQIIASEQRQCERHGEYTSNQANILGNVTGFSGCPKCVQEAMREETRREVERMQRENAQRRIEYRMKRAGIPPRFAHCEFEGYRVADDNPAQVTALRICKRYADKFAEGVRDRGYCLALLGSVGTGKTHLACAIANQIMRDGYSALFLGAVEAIQRLRESWRGKSDKTELEILQEFAEVDLLILDEVGVQYGSEAEIVQLTQIIDKRYQLRKPTIIISNLTRDALVAVVGERIMDRICGAGSGKIVPFEWSSYRQKRAADQDLGG